MESIASNSFGWQRPMLIGGKGGRFTSSASDQIRVRDQFKDRQGAGSGCSPDAARPCRRSDRMSTTTSAFAVFEPNRRVSVVRRDSVAKLFCVDQHKFSGPYTRRCNNDLRGYTVLR